MADSTPRRRPRHLSRHRPPTLPTPLKAIVVVFGWLVILVGLAGLVLPGLQGIVTLLLGGALLSLVSSTAHLCLRWLFRPWPRGWRRMLRLRRRAHRWLLRAWRRALVFGRRLRRFFTGREQ